MTTLDRMRATLLARQVPRFTIFHDGFLNIGGLIVLNPSTVVVGHGGTLATAIGAITHQTGGGR